MKKVFISYHHNSQQNEKNRLSALIDNSGHYYNLKDMSVEVGDIDDNLPTDVIYRIIREEYLRDTDVTIVILGRHTKCRKHIDREVGSSLRSYGDYNTKNGLLVLLTDGFIQENLSVFLFSSDYKSIINQTNAGQRINDNVQSGYAVVAKFSDVDYNINALSQLVNKAYDISRRFNPDNSAPFRSKNSEDCSLNNYGF